MTTSRRSTSGTLTATGTSDAVHGRKVSATITSSGTATVAIQYLDFAHSWTTAKSYTATPTDLPVVVEDVVERSWRVNVTAYTSGTVAYSLSVGA